MKLTICDPSKCTGCMACLNICKKNAIQIREDILGFKSPIIVPERCNECNLCIKICPSNNLVRKYFPLECYALQKSDDDRTASGGAATVLSEFVLTNGGVIYGCSGEDITHVKHVRVTSLAQLNSIKGSKYVQSEIGLIYREVKEDLRDNRKVLFIGTPCQVAGLKAFLVKEYEYLYTADLVCHGVPSQRMFDNTLALYKAKNNRLRFLSFRKKSCKYRGELGVKFGLFLDDNSKEVCVPWYKDPYMKGFMTNLFFRDSCYTCPYAYSVRVGDFTLSDFWGLEHKNLERLNIKNGISAVLINTEKALSLFKHIDEQYPNVTIVKRTVQEAITGNKQLQVPSRQHKNNRLFKDLYLRKDFKKAVNICVTRSVWKFLIMQSLYRFVAHFRN